MMAQRHEMIGLLILVALALVPPALTFLAFMDWLKSRLVGSRRRRWLPKVALAADVLLVLCLLDGWFIEPHRVTVTRITDSSPKVALGAGELKIVHISDIHFERDNPFVRNLLRTVASEKPDIIVLTGDIPQLGPFDQEQLREWLGKLRRIAPVYAVPGYYEDEAVIQGSPISDGVLLTSEHEQTEVRGTRIVLQGFGPGDRISAADRPDTDDALYIVLDHTPDSIPYAARLKPDWFFCGHTHGGQVRLPFWGAIITASHTGKQYEYGRYRIGTMEAFVTRGIGLEPRPAPQVRFLCPPEIVALTIRGATSRADAPVGMPRQTDRKSDGLEPPARNHPMHTDSSPRPEKPIKEHSPMPEVTISVVDIPDASPGIQHAPANRKPLLPNPMVKLPLGTVRPLGWIRHQLDLMVDGQTGRLTEISKFLADDNGWFGTPNDGWEEQAYWLRGFYDLGALTGDERIRAESLRWIEAVIASQQDDGYFGPPAMKSVVGKNGRVIVDLWPHMVMLDALRSHWEFTRDRRVIELAERFFRFCAEIPEEQFIPPSDPEFGAWRPFIQRARAGDMLPHIYWLYNVTGEEWLLDLATRFYEHIEPPQGKWLDNHVVNFTQRFRYPGNYYIQSHDPAHLTETVYWYDMHMATWGQQPGGIFGADECIREGKTDPRQGCETCALIEFNKSFYILGEVTGQALYADRVEDIMFNSFPASQPPDLKALHYLTAANQPQLDASTNHDYFNKGRQIDYSPHIYRCCQHNVAMGWPYYAEHLWMAGPGNGIVAWMYGASEVTHKLGWGQMVTIREETDYPFDTHVRMRFSINGSVAFPLYLRVPKWCDRFSVKLNGEPIEVRAIPGAYVVLDRNWCDSDVLEIEMPVSLSITRWERPEESVTVNRGPLSFSLKIGEDWRKQATGTDDWPDWEVFPTTPWNYGLALDEDNPATSLQVVEKGVVPDQPWTQDAAPIEIKAKGRRIPDWALVDETVAGVPPSPVESDEPIEEITLIPMGCARLRMSCLPVIGER